MGVHTLGGLLRLPRAGFARRFGPGLLADLDRLLGRRADPRRRLAPRERFRGARDLDHEAEDHERILQELAPLLEELERFLRTRQRGITALQCRFHHYRAAPTRCTLRLTAPESDAARMSALLRERLAMLTLPEPVRRCELRSGVLLERAAGSRPLWSPGERGHRATGEMPALVEYLRARLGAGAVYGIGRVSEHRPERAWRVMEPTLAAAPGPAAAGVPAPRPSWLLAAPLELEAPRGRPRHGGALTLLGGPECIESGWWDGEGVRRDYYLAADVHGARLWIFREHGAPRRWFLHGIFG
jgi:protein ImuB